MTSPAPAYRRNPSAKRERLLASAQELFAQQGFDATTTAQIAKAAGVSEGILFHHFSSKKGLFVALAQQYATAAAEATMPASLPLPTQEDIVRRAFDFADANPALYDMMSKGAGELSVAEIDAQNDILISSIAETLVRGMRLEQVRPGNARIMAQLQFSVVDGAWRAWRREGSADDREAYIQEAMACMKAMLMP